MSGGSWVLGDHGEHLVTMTCLYKAILGRAPDAPGLAGYIGDLQAGRSLEEIAASMIGSEEAHGQRGEEGVVDVLLRNLLGRVPDQRERELPPVELAVNLAIDPAIRSDQNLVAALFPHGVPIDNDELYRLWLAQQRAWRATRYRPRPTAVGTPFLSVVVLSDCADPSAVVATLSSLGDPIDGDIEVLVAARGGLPRAVRKLSGGAARAVTTGQWRGEAALLRGALRQCRGAFVTLVAAGDHLDPTVLSELALVEADADLVQTDEDRLGVTGLVGNPRFGPPRWDPDLAVARPPSGLLIVRAALARAVGGWRPAADGQRDWDLLLRASRRLPEDRIRRVPAVLLHRGSSAPVLTAATRKARLVALRGHLEASGRRGCRVVAGPEPEGAYRVLYPLPAEPPLVSIIVPTRDRADLLQTCLDGLLGQTLYAPIEVLIVDNGSCEAETMALFTRVTRDPRVRLLSYPHRFNWSAMNNIGVAAMRGSVAVLLNNDIEVMEPDWLTEMVRQAMRPEVGLVAAKLLYPEGTIQHAGMAFAHGQAVHVGRYAPGDSPGHDGLLRAVRTVTAATGACLAFRRAVFEEVGGIEQDALAVTWSDVDLCLRMRRAGYRVVFTPHATLRHVESATRGSDAAPAAAARFAREHAYMLATWGDALDHDPCFSPNLEVTEGAPRLAGQPRAECQMGIDAEK